MKPVTELKSDGRENAARLSGPQRKRARSLDDLIAADVLTHATQKQRAAAAWYPVSVPTAMQELIDPADPADPIAAQFIPQEEELRSEDAERDDPIGDLSHMPVKGIVHRYPDRVLLNLLQACPAYCRFCFRRGRVGPRGGLLSCAERDAALAYIADHKELWEVILSGGDPLMLSDRRLRDIMDRLGAIKHVKILRIHSRVPVVDPERITDRMIQSLRAAGRPVYLMVHCNHPRELTPLARAALARLADAGIILLSQSVLLRGINDNVETLTALMRAFVEARVKPHYLHHPDLARGTAHFRVSLERGQALVGALRGTLSGLCQPTYILDIPGGAGKIPLTPPLLEKAAGGWYATDFHGQQHLYKESAPFDTLPED